jgi:hypothetical protein
MLRDPWPESIYLRAHHTQLGYTIETPSSFPLHRRIDAFASAIEVAVKGTCCAIRQVRE